MFFVNGWRVVTSLSDLQNVNIRVLLISVAFLVASIPLTKHMQLETSWKYLLCTTFCSNNFVLSTIGQLETIACWTKLKHYNTNGNRKKNLKKLLLSVQDHLGTTRSTKASYCALPQRRNVKIGLIALGDCLTVVREYRRKSKKYSEWKTTPVTFK